MTTLKTPEEASEYFRTVVDKARARIMVTEDRQHIAEVLYDLLEMKKAIHSQLAGEWTGIKTDGTRTSINPHLEQFDAFTKAQALIRQTLDPISSNER